MDDITAYKAFEISKQINPELNIKETILHVINLAIESGEMYVKVYQFLSDNIVEWLQSKGYEVFTMKGYKLINWESNPIVSAIVRKNRNILSIKEDILQKIVKQIYAESASRGLYILYNNKKLSQEIRDWLNNLGYKVTSYSEEIDKISWGID